MSNCGGLGSRSEGRARLRQWQTRPRCARRMANGAPSCSIMKARYGRHLRHQWRARRIIVECAKRKVQIVAEKPLATPAADLDRVKRRGRKRHSPDHADLDAVRRGLPRAPADRGCRRYRRGGAISGRILQTGRTAPSGCASRRHSAAYPHILLSTWWISFAGPVEGNWWKPSRSRAALGFHICAKWKNTTANNFSFGQPGYRRAAHGLPAARYRHRLGEMIGCAWPATRACRVPGGDRRHAHHGQSSPATDSELPPDGSLSSISYPRYISESRQD